MSRDRIGYAEEDGDGGWWGVCDLGDLRQRCGPFKTSNAALLRVQECGSQHQGRFLDAADCMQPHVSPSPP